MYGDVHKKNWCLLQYVGSDDNEKRRNGVTIWIMNHSDSSNDIYANGMPKLTPMVILKLILIC